MIDVSGPGTTGYRVADWARAHHGVNLHTADHRRVNAQLTHADDQHTAEALLKVLEDVSAHAADLHTADRVRTPSPSGLGLEQVLLPRDAYFGPVEDVPRQRAAGRIIAEMLTPYPPGIPAALPGERLSSED
jgi:arginine decarboxylase